MRRQVSPMFAAIVIIVAIVLGALYFMVRYKAQEARDAELARILQAQADQARRSGRAGRAMGRARRAREGTLSPPGESQPGGTVGGESSEEPESTGQE